MTRRSYKGNAVPTTLSGGINSVVTSIAVTDGSTFPDGSAGPFFVVLDKGLVGEEKVLVTTRVGNTFTVVTRGQDDTSASSHSSGASVNHCYTKTDADEANAHVNASAAVHGLSGTVVGTNDAQALTNKTVNLASNTVSGTTAQFNTALSDNDFATLAGTEVLTNKTLTSPAINGATSDAASTIGGVSGTALAADRTAWTAYTPSLTGITLGNGSVSGRYKLVGKTLHLSVIFTAGTTTAYTGGFFFSLPGGVTAVTGVAQYLSGTVVPAGTSFLALAQIASGATTAQLLAAASNTVVGVNGVDPTHPGAWTATSANVFAFSGVIEVA